MFCLNENIPASSRLSCERAKRMISTFTFSNISYGQACNVDKMR